MARPWQYTRSRRTMMQGVMWLILGGTVGLAALVDRYRANPQSMSLGPTITYGVLQFRPPEGWRGERDGRRLVFKEEGSDPDSGADGTGRFLVIDQDPVRNTQAQQVQRYLAAKASDVGALAREVTPIAMCGQQGLLATVQEPAVLIDGQREEGWSLLAGTVLPSSTGTVGIGAGIGVSIQLHTPRRPTGADAALVKAVARAMAPAAAPTPLVPARARPRAIPVPAPAPAPQNPDDLDGR